MTRIYYLNGDYVPEGEAKVSVMDRGFTMADAVYEVIAVIEGKLVDFDGHFARLGRSTAMLGIAMPFDRDGLLAALRQMVSRNALDGGGVYLQVTRGVAERDFLMPKTLTPTVVMFTQARDVVASPLAQKGARVLTRPDLRWQRGNIKTTQLLYASLMKTEAVRAGYDDCWLERDGVITEGTSNNTYIVKDGVIFTKPISNDILAGITRATLLELVAAEGLRLEERDFTIAEAEAADEAFFTSAGALVTGVTQINDRIISNGAVGAITAKMRALYLANARKTAI